MRAVRRGERGELSILIAIVLLGVAALFGGYKLIGWSADYLAEKIPDEVEVDIFSKLGGRKTAWSTTPESEAEKRASSAFDRLAKTPDLRKLAYRLHFMPESEPNAFAMPGGTIAVTKGLLSLVESDIGVAMVLGHEFGHQQHRHALRSMGRSLLLAGIMLLVVGDAGAVVTLALDMAERSHSREQELEADAYGLRMVHRAFGTTAGADEFFTKLETNPLTKGNKLLSMLSTHPYTPDRIESLRKLQREIDPAALETPQLPKRERSKRKSKATL